VGPAGQQRQLEHHSYEEKLRAGVVQSGEEKAVGRSYCGHSIYYSLAAASNESATWPPLPPATVQRRMERNWQKTGGSG